MESRRRQDSAEMRVDRQEIGEYAAMCCEQTEMTLPFTPKNADRTSGGDGN